MATPVDISPVGKGRWLGLGVSLVLLLLAVLAVCEALGWPFLAPVLERQLSSLTQRQVRFSNTSDAAAQQPVSAGSQRFQLRFLGAIRLRAPQLQIAAPDWSSAPYLVAARDIVLELRYGDVWRAYRGEGGVDERNQPYRIHRLEAAWLKAHLERRTDGSVSWQLGSATVRDRPTPIPQFGTLRMAQGQVFYDDAPLTLTGVADVSWSSHAAGNASRTDERRAVADSGTSNLRMQARGTYQKLPVVVALQAFGNLPGSTEASASTATAIKLDATVGRAKLLFLGSAADPLSLNELSGRFEVNGPSLAAVGLPFGVTLPTTTAFQAEGLVAKSDALWRVRLNQATVGASRLNGAFTYDMGGAKPVLAGRLGGTRLALVDLGPAVGVEPVRAVQARSSGKVLPDKPFNLVALRAMDANVLIDFQEVDLNSRLLEPFVPLRGHLRLLGGVLTITDLDARTAQGQVRGFVMLDGRPATALWRSDLRWEGVQLARFVKQKRATGNPSYISGRLSGQTRLQGRGNSTAAILGSLQGQARTQLDDGAISHLVVEAAGLDLAQGLGLYLGRDESLKVLCGVADLVAQGGVFRPRVMVLDTNDSAIWVEGTLSLATELIDLRAVVMPKDFSPLTFRTPLLVRGNLSQPTVSLDKGPMSRTLVSAFLLALVNPLAALIPLIDPGDADAANRNAAGCKSLVQRAGERLPTGPAKRKAAL